jgi:hypothetical protein
MPPKKGKSTAAKASPAKPSPGKASPGKASPAKVQAAMAVVPLETHVEKAALNCVYLKELDAAMATIRSHPLLANIEHELPMSITRANELFASGFQAPFSAADATTALFTTFQYQCGGNFFWPSFAEPTLKGKPYRRSGVQQLSDFFYGDGEPGFFAGVIVCALDNQSVNLEQNFTKFQELSPEEVRHAAVFSCAHQLRAGVDEDRVRQWKQFFLTSTVCFLVVPAELRHFKAVSLRQSITATHDGIAHTAFQMIVEVMLFKMREELTKGGKMSASQVAKDYSDRAKRAQSSEEVTTSFVDMANTVWVRALGISDVMAVVRKADEKWGLASVFDGVSKLQTIVQKAGTPQNITWAFAALFDLFNNGLLKDGGARALQGSATGQNGKGVIDEVLYKRDIMHHFVDAYLANKTLSIDERAAIRTITTDFDTHRAHCGCIQNTSSDEPVDCTWRAGFSEVADKVIDLVQARSLHNLDSPRSGIPHMFMG